MTPATFIDRLFMATALALAAAALIATAVPAHAHGWYVQRSDPVFGNGCCGGNDCDEFKFNGALIEAQADGYRIRLTVKQSQEVNILSSQPVDALVPWSRVQESEDGKWHLCIFNTDRDPPRNGVICFFAPPSM